MPEERIAKRYRILRFLSEGGMGSVHEAEDEVTGERVAVKLIHKSRLASRRAQAAAERFRREARAAAVATGENVVRVIEDGVDEETGDLFIVMELLEGEDLDQLLQRSGPLAPHLALRIAGQALRGLHRAHEAGVVHRDIKPGNIFLARRDDGEMVVKLLDFGIAKVLDESRDLAGVRGLTTTGNVLGSPLFMSPEQVKSSKHVDLRSDIWSIGSVLYCMLAGCAPHEPEAASVGTLLLAICHKRARPVHDLAPWVPAPISQILQRALAIDPRDRYASAAEMLDALRPFAPDLTLREDMWRNLPVLVSVPPPPSEDSEGYVRDAHLERGPSLALAETEPSGGAAAVRPASADGKEASPGRTDVALLGQGLTKTMTSPIHGEAAADAVACCRPSEETTGKASSSRSGETTADGLTSSVQEELPPPAGLARRAPVSPSPSAPPSAPSTGRKRRGAMALGAALLAGGLAAAAALRPPPGFSEADPGASPSASPPAASAGASPVVEGAALHLRIPTSPADAAAFAGGAERERLPDSVHAAQLSQDGGALDVAVPVTERRLRAPRLEGGTPPPASSSSVPPVGSRSPPLQALDGESAKRKPPPPASPSAKPPPNEPPSAPNPPADDLMHDHR